MYAVIETGGKQYCVKPGDQLKIEKLDIKAGEKVTFDKVLAAGAGADVQIGTPYVEAAKVVAKFVRERAARAAQLLGELADLFGDDG